MSFSHSPQATPGRVQAATPPHAGLLDRYSHIATGCNDQLAHSITPVPDPRPTCCDTDAVLQNRKQHRSVLAFVFQRSSITCLLCAVISHSIIPLIMPGHCVAAPAWVCACQCQFRGKRLPASVSTGYWFHYTAAYPCLLWPAYSAQLLVLVAASPFSRSCNAV